MSIYLDDINLESFGAIITTRDGWSAFSGFTGEDIKIPGRDGSKWREKDKDSSRMSFDILLSGQSPTELKSNIDGLMRLLGQSHRQIQIDRVVEDGSIHRNFGQVSAVISPSYQTPTDVTITLEFILTDPHWTDRTSSTFSGSGTSLALTTFAGTIAPISDATISITGNGNNITITDEKSGAWVKVAGAVAGTLILDCKNFGATLNGLSIIDRITFGPRRKFFELTPGEGLIPRITIAGMSATPTVQVVASRKYY